MSDSDIYRHVLTTTPGLAQKHNLKVNDASFLELAQRLEVALATYDKALFGAAASRGDQGVARPTAGAVNSGSPSAWPVLAGAPLQPTQDVQGLP